MTASAGCRAFEKLGPYLLSVAMNGPAARAGGTTGAERLRRRVARVPAQQPKQ